MLRLVFGHGRHLSRLWIATLTLLALTSLPALAASECEDFFSLAFTPRPTQSTRIADLNLTVGTREQTWIVLNKAERMIASRDPAEFTGWALTVLSELHRIDLFERATVAKYVSRAIRQRILKGDLSSDQFVSINKAAYQQWDVDLALPAGERFKTTELNLTTGTVQQAWFVLQKAEKMIASREPAEFTGWALTVLSELPQIELFKRETVAKYVSRAIRKRIVKGDLSPDQLQSIQKAANLQWDVSLAEPLRDSFKTDDFNLTTGTDVQTRFVLHKAERMITAKDPNEFTDWALTVLSELPNTHLFSRETVALYVSRAIRQRMLKRDLSFENLASIKEAARKQWDVDLTEPEHDALKTAHLNLTTGTDYQINVVLQKAERMIAAENPKEFTDWALTVLSELPRIDLFARATVAQYVSRAIRQRFLKGDLTFENFVQIQEAAKSQWDVKL